MTDCRITAILMIGTLLLANAAPLAAQPASLDKLPAVPGGPLTVVENVGQFPAGARFQVRGRQGIAWLAEDTSWIRLALPGANPRPRLEPFDRLATRVSFFIGSDPAHWQADVPAWGGLRYRDVYPGLDLELSGAGWQLVRSTGRAQSPQDQPGELLYSTFLGGSNFDTGHAIALDTSGAAYVTGWTISADFPATPGAYDPSYNAGQCGPYPCGDAFVAKFDAAGKLVYATFLGGSGEDGGYSLALDGSGAVYAAGKASSPDFPTTAGAHDTTHNPGVDGFVVKLNAAGSELIYATYLGGSVDDYVRSMAVDTNGTAYLTGLTTSPDFPATPGAFDTTYGGGTYSGDGFVARLKADGSALEYATFLGGSGNDMGYGIALDGSGAAYITGNSFSSDFPITPGAYQPARAGGVDAFVAKLNESGSGLIYSTFLGGAAGADEGHAITLDESGAAYVTGLALSADFPTTPGAFDSTHNGNDAFVSKLNAAGSALVYSTFLGGSGSDAAQDIAIDKSGAAYVIGETGSSGDFPITPDAYDATYNGHIYDAFVARLNGDGSQLLYSTFLGGSAMDEGLGIAVDDRGTAFVTGSTHSANFPTTPGAPDMLHQQSEAFVTRLAAGSLPPTYAVTGRLTGSSGQGIPALHVSAGASYSATADAGGVYTITGLPAGVYTISPPAGYFWSPASRVVSLPPDAAGQDFTGGEIYKQVTPASPGSASPGDALTYTLHLIAPTTRTLMVYDHVPTYTSYLSGSLDAPAGVVYDAGANAISGTLALNAAMPVTISFVARVEVAGTAGFAPLIVNRACVHPPGSGLADCTWSNQVHTYTYAWLLYLPVVLR